MFFSKLPIYLYADYQGFFLKIPEPIVKSDQMFGGLVEILKCPFFVCIMLCQGATRILEYCLYFSDEMFQQDWFSYLKKNQIRRKGQGYTDILLKLLSTNYPLIER